ncbi:hypothetical protein WN48_07115 [Eufriesea mexicana]|uniref:Shugoshin C-terminal domain-containing protein n=1 Tax=Eufriesea mexicana TaxID=516756 RepID=A0A310SXD3_9HYME|nr:hypothetical protein WN48_07115 [Eufriesea mexicana]
MPQILKHFKRSQKRVLVKRRHFLTNYPEIKFYKPLCKKLQNNNNSLAKALSKEKQESQLLFSQNVALIAEVQDLGLACNKRDSIISNVLKNAKEMLKMLVTMTGYLTNTISSCQEFADSVATNVQMSYNSAEKTESMKRLSIKSPTKGVVKPMVSGYTITKPTINLSRVNMQHINNPSNLSIIPEVTTPPRNEELNSSRSSNVSERQRKCKNGRTYRMPERLIIASPRDSDENERRLSERNSRHSGRMSRRLSKSKSRLSRNSSSRFNIENLEHIGSPRVKLNDVSKLLQNSHSINIRMLTESQNNQEINSSENSDGVALEDSQTGIIQETPPSDDDSKDDNDKPIENESEQSNNQLDTTAQQEKEKVNETKRHTTNWEDPLEGPSWLFNNSQVVPSFTSKDKKTDDVDVSNNDIMSTILNAAELEDVFNNEKSMEEMSSLSMPSRHSRHMNNSKSSKPINDESESNIFEENENNDAFYNMNVVTDTNGDECTTESASTMNLPNFVTQRRGYFESEDEDDFTLMYVRQPRNMHFDINDLKLPVLEQSTLKPMVSAEPEPEVTTTLQKISQICPIPSVSHNSLDESAFNQSTVKLPLLNSNYDEKEFTPLKKNLQQKKKRKKAIVTQSNDMVQNASSFRKSNYQKKRKNKLVQDPSTVKVVLQKLNESDVKSRTPSPNEILSRDSNQSLSPVSSHADNSSDSESSMSTNSTCTSSRPRRKRAPTSFYEPNLKIFIDILFDVNKLMTCVVNEEDLTETRN